MSYLYVEALRALIVLQQMHDGRKELDQLPTYVAILITSCVAFATCETHHTARVPGIQGTQ